MKKKHFFFCSKSNAPSDREANANLCQILFCKDEKRVCSEFVCNDQERVCQSFFVKVKSAFAKTFFIKRKLSNGNLCQILFCKDEKSNMFV